MKQSADILIIGAGMAGIAAARRLAAAGKDILLLEKETVVGGRMAIVEMGGARFDCGAQFFTVRDERFGAAVTEAEKAGYVTVWSHGFGEEDGHPRYRGKRGMDDFPRYLAAGLPIQTGVQLISVRTEGEFWVAESKDGRLFKGRALIMTPPAPQSLSLLTVSDTFLPFATQDALMQIRFSPSYTLLIALDGPSAIPSPGVVQLPQSPARWIADNQQKGISAEAALTVHAAQDFSKYYVDQPLSEVEQILLAAAKPWFGTAVPQQTMIIRWKYNIPLDFHPDRMLFSSEPLPIIFAGDAFCEPRVEGAYLSGLAAAEYLIARN